MPRMRTKSWKYEGFFYENLLCQWMEDDLGDEVHQGSQGINFVDWIH